MSYMDRKCSDTEEKQTIFFYYFFAQYAYKLVYLAIFILLWLIAVMLFLIVFQCLNYCFILSYINPPVLTEQNALLNVIDLNCLWNILCRP